MLILSEDQLGALEIYFDQYKQSKKKERKIMIDGIASEMGDGVPDITPMNLLKVRKQIQQWFAERLRKKKKNIVKYSGKWTPKMVFIREHAKEIEARNIEASGSTPGNVEYIKTLHTTIKEVWDEQSSEDQDRMKATAQSYNDGDIPREVQLKHAEKYAVQVYSEFAHYMFRQFGTRVWILAAMLDEVDDVAVEWHDYNPEISNIQAFTDYAPDWKDKAVLPLFRGYAQAVFGRNGESIPIKEKKKPKSLIQLDMDEDNLPLLPDEVPSHRPDMEAVIRQFVTGCYRYVCQNEKSAVPWGAIESDMSSFLAPEYIPKGAKLRDPSHMPLADGKTFFALWKVQEAKGYPTLDFLTYRAKDGSNQAMKCSIADLISRRRASGVPGGDTKRRKRTESASQPELPGKKSKVGPTGKPPPAVERVGGASGKLKGKAVDRQQKSRAQKKHKAARQRSEEEAESTSGTDNDDSDSQSSSEPDPNDDDEEEEEEDFRKALDDIRSDQDTSEVSKITPVPPNRAAIPPFGAPSGVDISDPAERLSFLKGLSIRLEYDAMIEAIGKIEPKSLGATPKGIPAFGDWTYPYDHLPLDVHLNHAKAKQWLSWLATAPYTTASGKLRGYGMIERVALMVGMFLRDLSAVQFHEPDDDTVPHFIRRSTLEFMWGEKLLMPICNDLTQCVNLNYLDEEGGSASAPPRKGPGAASKVGLDREGGGTRSPKKKADRRGRRGRRAANDTGKNEGLAGTAGVQEDPSVLNHTTEGDAAQVPPPPTAEERPSDSPVRIQPGRTKKNQPWNKNAGMV